MYAMNFEFQIWLVMSTILAYISRELQKLLYVLQWGEQVSVKTSVMHMTCYPLNKICICQLDPETPGIGPETPDKESGESGLYPGVSGPSEPEHRKTTVSELKQDTY